MKKVWICLSVVLLLLTVIPAALSYRRYNVILVTIDTLRADYLSCYNPKAPPTPNLDRLAREGVLFENAYSLIPITLPAHAAMLTSHPPHELGLFNNGEFFSSKQPSISELLARKGYATAGFTSLGVLSRKFNINRGFQTYEGYVEGESLRSYKLASEVNELVYPWLEKVRDRPFFAWIHYSDPHEPYITVDAPPDTEIWVNDRFRSKYCLATRQRFLLKLFLQPGENKIEFRTVKGLAEAGIVESSYLTSRTTIQPKRWFRLTPGDNLKRTKAENGSEVWFYRGSGVLTVVNSNSRWTPATLRFAGGVTQSLDVILRNYQSEVQYADRYFGLLRNKLSNLGIQSKTILIVTADHGEGLNTHGSIGHIYPIYNEITHVPMIIYYPVLGRAKLRVHDLVNHLDIMPTFLDLIHEKTNAVMRGHSLKHYLSRSPVDWLFTSRIKRVRTFTSTYTPESPVNSFAVIDRDFKLIQTESEKGWQSEAYDLLKDPLEKTNLTGKDSLLFQDQRFFALRTLLEQHTQEAQKAHQRRNQPTLNEQDIEMLQNLGYVAGKEE